MDEIILSNTQVDVLKHALGLDRGKKAYRNHYCEPLDAEQKPTRAPIQSLSTRGLMRLARFINERADGIFVVTDAGKQALARYIGPFKEEES